MATSRLPLRTVHESPPSHGSSKSCTTQLGSPERCDRSGCGRPGRPGTKPGLGRAGSPRGSVCSTGVLHLTCPAVGVLPVVLWVTHLTHVSGLSAQARGPYPPGYDFPVPYGGWPSLLGSSCARCGVGPSFQRSSGLLAGGPDRNGVTMFRTREARRGRVPSVPRGRGVRGGSGSGLPPVCPVIAVVINHRLSATFDDAASAKVHSRSPGPSFPGPVPPDGSESPWASPACFRTLRYLALAQVGNWLGHSPGPW